MEECYQKVISTQFLKGLFANFVLATEDSNKSDVNDVLSFMTQNSLVETNIEAVTNLNDSSRLFTVYSSWTK